MSSSSNSSSSIAHPIVARRRRPSPCGGCRVLRRRCVPDCPFAPYFGYHETDRFRAVHQVFGAFRVRRLIRGLNSGHHRAVNMLVEEAQIRLQDPINGCFGVIEGLRTELANTTAEREALRCRMNQQLMHLSMPRQQPPAVQQPLSRLSWQAVPPPGGQGLDLTLSLGGPYSRNPPPPAGRMEVGFTTAPDRQSSSNPSLTTTLASPYWHNPAPAPHPETEGRAAAAAMRSRVLEMLRAGAGGRAAETRGQGPAAFRSRPLERGESSGASPSAAPRRGMLGPLRIRDVETRSNNNYY